MNHRRRLVFFLMGAVTCLALVACTVLRPDPAYAGYYRSEVYPVSLSMSSPGEIVVFTSKESERGTSLILDHLHMFHLASSGPPDNADDDRAAATYEASAELLGLVTAYQFAYFISPVRPPKRLPDSSLLVTTVVLCKKWDGGDDSVDWTEWALKLGLSPYRSGQTIPPALQGRYLAAEAIAKQEKRGIWARPRLFPLYPEITGGTGSGKGK